MIFLFEAKTETLDARLKCIVYCWFLHDMATIYLSLIGPKEADRVGRIERKAQKSTKPHKPRQRDYCAFSSHKVTTETQASSCSSRQPRSQQYHNSMQIHRVNCGRGDKKSNKTKAERETVRREKDGCRRLIIGIVIWRDLLLTTRPPPPISSLSLHLTDTSLNIPAYWSVTIGPFCWVSLVFPISSSIALISIHLSLFFLVRLSFQFMYLLSCLPLLPPSGRLDFHPCLFVDLFVSEFRYLSLLSQAFCFTLEVRFVIMCHPLRSLWLSCYDGELLRL